VFSYAEAAMAGQRTGGDLAVRMPELSHDSDRCQ
jgi:hypothetical protein